MKRYPDTFLPKNHPINGKQGSDIAVSGVAQGHYLYCFKKFRTQPFYL
jgi:hypothetical protein